MDLNSSDEEEEKVLVESREAREAAKAERWLAEAVSRRPTRSNTDPTTLVQLTLTLTRA